MITKRIAVKRYVMKLSEAERERLNTLIHAGKHPARQLTRPSLACSLVHPSGWRARTVSRRSICQPEHLP